MKTTFSRRVRVCFEHLYNRLEALGFDVDLVETSLSFPVQNAALPYLFKVHETNQEIWLSSPLSGGHRFTFDVDEGAWLNIRTQQSLDSFLRQELATEDPFF